MKKFVCFLTGLCVIILCCLSGCGADKTKQVFSQFDKNDLPPYYQYYMEAKVGQIKYIEENNDIALNFAFLTDLHWDYNAKHSPELLKYVCDKTKVDKAVFGGDYISTDYDTPEQSLEIMSNCFNSFDLNKYYAILGNHDTNTNNGWDTTFIPFSKSMETISRDNQSEPYYRVDDSYFCFFFLNTNDFKSGNEQYQWLCEQLKSLSADKTVLIFMHEYYSCYGNPLKVDRNANGTLIDELLYSNREQINCKIAAIFTGHIHYDYFSYNSYGCPVVATTCDGFDVRPDNDEYYREKGTITEQAFDIVQVDTTNRKIFLTRIGAGNDRVYKY